MAECSEADISSSQFAMYSPGSSMNHYLLVCYTDKSQIIKNKNKNERKKGEEGGGIERGRERGR